MVSEKVNITFHLVPLAYWDSLDPRADYTPEPFAREGFIHCTDGADEMARTANRYYRDNPAPHVYLYIDQSRVRAPMRYDAEPRIYPHIYGALNRDAIVAVRPARRASDGAFLPPEELSAPKESSLIALKLYRDFRLLWTGQVISSIGNQMQMVAINWHIYNLTHSPVMLGLTGLMRVVPIVIFSLFGGVVADAHDRRRLMIITQTLMMIFAAILGLTTNLDLISAYVIYAMAATTAATTAFDSPARQALAPNLVKKEHLTNALSLNNINMQVASITGPMLAGFVIAGLGVGAVYWINALSFLAVIIALVAMKTPTQKNLGVAKVNLDSLTEGIRYVFNAKIIRATMLLDFIATFFSSASALLPIFAQDILKVGPEGLGVLYGAEAVGAVIAGILVARAGNIKRQGAILLAAVASYGLATAFYGVSQLFALSFFFLALVGASDTVSTIIRNTIRQLATPDHLRGRMTSVNMIFFMGGPQLGNLEAGLVAAAFGAPFAVVSGGVATVIAVGVTAWLAPQLRKYSGQ
ncbi:MAG: MFS transporter [Chloroflexi bacterium]|nr:MFS transporter [Chloroflexota bacterium]